MTKLALNYFLIAALVFSAAFTSCGSRGSGNAKLLETDSFYIDPHFDIYGEWAWEIDDPEPASFYGLTGNTPTIRINSDNTIDFLFYESTGIMTQTDTYRFSVAAERDRDEYDEFIFIYDPDANLLKRTCEGQDDFYYRKKTDDGLTSRAEAFPCYVEFNGKTITMAIFYSPSDGEFFTLNLDSLKFAYDGKIQSVIVDTGSSFLDLFADGADGLEDISLIRAGDFNFDGYMDIEILIDRGVSNTTSACFIYNPGTQSFHGSEILSRLVNVSFDAETQTVSTFNVSGAGRYYSSEEYKWEGVELVLFRTVNQAPDENEETLIRTTRTLHDGEWTEETETIKTEDLE